MNYNAQVGRFGEALARKYLLKKGYKIIGQNVKLSYQEIDLVTKRKNQIIFIEVKTRTSDSFGQAEEAMTQAKIGKLKKARNHYLVVNNFDPEQVRFDLLAIDIDRVKKIAKIKHYLDIF